MNNKKIETTKTVLEIILEVCKTIKDVLDKKDQK